VLIASFLRLSVPALREQMLGAVTPARSIDRSRARNAGNSARGRMFPHWVVPRVVRFTKVAVHRAVLHATHCRRDLLFGHRDERVRRVFPVMSTYAPAALLAFKFPRALLSLPRAHFEFALRGPLWCTLEGSLAS